MSNNQTIDDQLEELEAELRDQKARFQEELTAAITLHTKKCEDLDRRQINALKRENLRIKKIIVSLPACCCKFKPAVCNICGKVFRNRRTHSQHLKYTHRMSEMSLDGQTQNFDYQYPNYQGNGNGNSWGPLLPFHTYTPAANPSVPE